MTVFLQAGVAKELAHRESAGPLREKGRDLLTILCKNFCNAQFLPPNQGQTVDARRDKCITEQELLDHVSAPTTA
jgi:hypothetical protein